VKPCTRCGKLASIWTRDATTGICRNCRNEDQKNAPQEIVTVVFMLVVTCLLVYQGLIAPLWGSWEQSRRASEESRPHTAKMINNDLKQQPEELPVDPAVRLRTR
jgi:hypothetical protein